MMDNLKLIIFDFDGTIADTMEAGIEITNKIAEQLNFTKLDKSKIDYYRTLEPKQFLKLMQIPLLKIPLMAGIYHIEFNKVIHKLKPFPGIPEVLNELEKHYKLGILSSNSVENIEKFLELNNLRHLFDFVHSQPHIFGKSSSLRKILRRRKLTKDQVVYVGDEVRDIQAAHQLKIPVISVTWGLNARELLEKYKPEYLIDTPGQLLDILTGKNSGNNQNTSDNGSQSHI